MKKPKTKAEIKKFAKIYAENSIAGTAGIFGCSCDSVIKWAKDFKEDPRYKELFSEGRKPAPWQSKPKTKKEKERLIELYGKNGYRAIAKMYGVSPQAVSCWMKDLKNDPEYADRVALRGPGAPRADFLKTEEDKLAFIDFYNNNIKTDVAEKYGHSLELINRTARELKKDERYAGKFCRPENKPLSLKMPTTDEEIRKFIKKRNESTYKQLSEEYGVHLNTVMRWCRSFEKEEKYKKLLKPKKTYKNYVPKTEEEIERFLSCCERENNAKLARRYNVTPATIKNWKDKLLEKGA